MHCECWIPLHCDATIEWERSEKVRNPGYLNALWRNRESNHMPALVGGDTSDALKQGCQTCFSSGANSGIFNLKRAGPM